MVKNKLSLVKEPGDFFKELLVETLSQLRVKVLPHTQSYLVNLMDQFVLTDRLYSTNEKGEKCDEPLAFMLKAAIEATDPKAQSAMFRHIGDVSLYTAGFFQDSLSRRLVDVDYYIGMGCSAYQNVAQRTMKSSQRSLYSELAFKFSSLVDVLAEMSSQTSMKTEKDLLRLYDLWIKTQSVRAEKALSRAGIQPNRILKKKLQ